MPWSFSIRVVRPSAKVATVESRSRSLPLDFVNVFSSSDETRSVTPLPMPIEVSQSFMNIIYLPIHFTVINKYSHPYTYVSNPYLNPKPKMCNPIVISLWNISFRIFIEMADAWNCERRLDFSRDIWSCISEFKEDTTPITIDETSWV
jgi:hypothetical protein